MARGGLSACTLAHAGVSVETASVGASRGVGALESVLPDREGDNRGILHFRGYQTADISLGLFIYTKAFTVWLNLNCD